MLWWKILLNWILICFSEKYLFLRCYVCKQFFGIAYFTAILSFEKFYKNLHWNLKLIFLFSTLFVHFEIDYSQAFIAVLRFFFFLIYEINAVVSIHINAFYPATSALKMLYVNFSGQDLLRFACCLSFLFINVFLTNLLTFYDFLLLLYIMFFLSTNMTKTDMKKTPK